MIESDNKSYRSILCIILIFGLLFGKVKYLKHKDVTFPNVTVIMAIHKWRKMDSIIDLIEIDLYSQKMEIIGSMDSTFGGIPVLYSNHDYELKDFPENSIYDNEIRIFKSYYTDQNIIVGMDRDYMPFSETQLLHWDQKREHGYEGRLEFCKTELKLYDMGGDKHSSIFRLPYDYSLLIHHRYLKENNIILYSYAFADNGLFPHENCYTVTEINTQNQIVLNIDREGSWEFDYFVKDSLLCYWKQIKGELAIELYSIQTKEAKIVTVMDYGSCEEIRFINENWLIYTWNEGVDFFNDEELRLVEINTGKNYTIIETKGENNRNFKYDFIANSH